MSTHLQSQPNDLHGGTSAEAANAVADHLVTSAAVAFCLGLGTGIVVVELLSASEPTRHENAARRLGEQLLGSLTSLLPDSIKTD